MNKKLILLIILSVFIIIIYKPEILEKLPFKFNTLTLEKIDLLHEKKDEEALHLSSPTLNIYEIRNLIKFKDSMYKPYTSVQNHPSLSEYKILSDITFKNLQSYISNLLLNNSVNNINYTIIPKTISPNLYYNIDSNLIYLTPIELEGTLIINNKEFGTISLMIVLRGATNSLYVPKDGLFINNIKYEMFTETFNIIKVVKNNTEPKNQRGFYATADTINYKVNDDKMPLNTIQELEDSETVNISEILNENEEDEIEPESETVSSTIDINY